MHPSVLQFVEQSLTKADVAARHVLEVGSYNINGSVRPYIESLKPAHYLGVDIRRGRGVDQVVDCLHLTDLNTTWDVVLCCEMLEHAADWRGCITEMAASVAPDGLLLITTRSPGFPYHPEPQDHWRYTLGDMEAIFAALGFSILTLQKDPLVGHPGVFVLARKSHTWAAQPGALDHITLTPADPTITHANHPEFHTSDETLLDAPFFSYTTTKPGDQRIL